MKVYIEYVGEENYEDRISVCELTLEDVDAVKKEYELFKNHTGDTYELTQYKNPSFEEFVKLYFGTPDYDMYMNEVFFDVPSKFVCSDEGCAKEFYAFMRRMEYHNELAQKYCRVELVDCTVSIYYGDY